jgi:predicted nucleotidyltransferase
MEEKIVVLIKRFPRFLEVCKRLNESDIPFFIGGSGCLFLLGNERLPDDLDLFLPDEFHEKANALFGIESFEYQSDRERVRNSNPFGEHAYQFTSHLVISVENRDYRLSISSDQTKQASLVEVQGVHFNLLPPEDVLLIKALLQRGEQEGKHDIEDMNRFIRLYPALDRTYLMNRVRTLGAEDRVAGLF